MLKISHLNTSYFLRYAHVRYVEVFYKHSETIEYVKKLAYFLRSLQTSLANNSRILRIKYAKFPGYCFYMNKNIYGDFQIRISIHLRDRKETCFEQGNFILIE